MKYILMMAGRKAGADAYRAWSAEAIEAHFAFLRELNEQLIASGELVDNQPLAPPEQAKVVRRGDDGMPITDGVFPESKEFLFGYWIVDVESADRAYEIAARLSGGPAPGGTRLSMPIEVRQLMSAKTSD